MSVEGEVAVVDIGEIRSVWGGGGEATKADDKINLNSRVRV